MFMRDVIHPHVACFVQGMLCCDRSASELMIVSDSDQYEDGQVMNC
jgi:hypothetical protein